MMQVCSGNGLSFYLDGPGRNDSCRNDLSFCRDGPGRRSGSAFYMFRTWLPEIGSGHQGALFGGRLFLFLLINIIDGRGNLSYVLRRIRLPYPIATALYDKEDFA